MGRTRPVDVIGWSLYRRAAALIVLALVVALATSFRPDAAVRSTLPPTFSNDQAAELLDAARTFDTRFADRRPGTSGSIDAAQWMRDQFDAQGWKAQTVTATTTDPATGASLGLVNVEAVLPGRTRELVVVHAHRDTADARGRGGDSVGQLALLELARELAATTDRRRTYMLVSTDGATMNGAGARALAERLQGRGAVVAVVGMDRLGAAGNDLHVPADPSGRWAPPLGLVTAARAAVAAEQGDGSPAGTAAQVLALATPVTLHEHGQLVARGLPAVTISSADGQLHDGIQRSSDVELGAALRSVQRLLGTVDAVDSLQSAGKTYVATEQRTYRGWALKMLIATLLVPVWIAAVDLLVRQRRYINVFQALGTCARAMLAGMWAVASLWLVGAAGLLPATGDRPPNPASLADFPLIGVTAWLVLAGGGWLLARGPDHRRLLRQGRVRTNVRDSGDILVALVLLVVISVLALGVNPYTVLFAVPALHAWLWLSSMQVHDRRALIGIWAAGLAGPLLAVLAIGARFDLGAGAPWYMLELVQTRTVPPMLGLLAGAAAGLAALLAIAALGRVAYPALPGLRRFVAGTSQVGAVRSSADLRDAARLMLGTAARTVVSFIQSTPSPRTGSRRRTAARRSTSRGAAGIGSSRAASDRARSEEQRVAERLERTARRQSDRPRVKSR